MLVLEAMNLGIYWIIAYQKSEYFRWTKSVGKSSDKHRYLLHQLNVKFTFQLFLYHRCVRILDIIESDQQGQYKTQPKSNP